MDVVDEMRWLVDSALDRAVVPGFSKVGGYRRRGGRGDDAQLAPATRAVRPRGIAASLVRLGASVISPLHR
ncbi:hypothetical protein [Mycobacterium rhizamassiliense]|jgi:hypothetical protein|uniref:hypothetical protein n=1 Tax=Mycobacterium rhizamassiliense TaxID=1841860 RepID=UPI00097CEFC1|nr:hypothetical protein [Mycobacterium rhizamassiliense]